MLRRSIIPVILCVLADEEAGSDLGALYRPFAVAASELDDRVGAALFGRKVRFETPRYDDEPVTSRLQDVRGQARQQQSFGPSTLVEAISNIFSP